MVSFLILYSGCVVSLIIDSMLDLDVDMIITWVYSFVNLLLVTFIYLIYLIYFYIVSILFIVPWECGMHVRLTWLHHLVVHSNRISYESRLDCRCSYRLLHYR